MSEEEIKQAAKEFEKTYWAVYPSTPLNPIAFDSDLIQNSFIAGYKLAKSLPVKPVELGYGYLCDLEGEKVFVVAENLSSAFDVLNNTGKKYYAIHSCSIDIIKPVGASSLPPVPVKDGMLENKVQLLEEDIECVHKYLDGLKIPKVDSDNKTYSIVGRIRCLEKKYLAELSQLETNYLTSPVKDVPVEDKKGSKEYWEQRCLMLENSLDETLTVKGRDECYHTWHQLKTQ